MNEKMNPKDAELANLLQTSAEEVNPSGSAANGHQRLRCAFRRVLD